MEVLKKITPARVSATQGSLRLDPRCSRERLGEHGATYDSNNTQSRGFYEESSWT